MSDGKENFQVYFGRQRRTLQTNRQTLSCNEEPTGNRRPRLTATRHVGDLHQFIQIRGRLSTGGTDTWRTDDRQFVVDSLRKTQDAASVGRWLRASVMWSQRQKRDFIQASRGIVYGDVGDKQATIKTRTKLPQSNWVWLSTTVKDW